MITVYVGTPGTGKSLHVVDDISRALLRGKNVITNFDFRYDKIKSKKKGDFKHFTNSRLVRPDFFYKYGLENNLDSHGVTIMGHTLIVIDEAQNLFDARQWNVVGRREWNEFFAQHRKYGYDIILITQRLDSLDKRIKGNAEIVVEHRNVKHYKFFGLILSLLFGGNLFVYIRRYLSTKDKIDSKYFRGNKKKYELYNSFALFDTVERDEEDAVKKPEKRSSKPLKII